MKISYRSLLILYCIHRFNGERTVYGVFHLLTGKKSSQTIGDANLYQLSHIFGTLRTISREHIEDSTNDLLKSQLIQELRPTSNKYILTTKGEDVLVTNIEQKPFPSNLNGWKYNDASSLLWQRLSLLTQVLSNLIRNNRNYTVIQQEDSMLEWVKEFLKQNNYDRYDVSEWIYKELLVCLESMSEIEATIFVLRLTSSNRIGYTIEQISSLIGEDETYCQLLFINTLHAIVENLEKNREEFPLLSSLLQTNDLNNFSLTSSTRYTLRLLLQRKSIDEIASLRSLKRNTIEDHIVEITHNLPDFSIDPYVSMAHQKNIIAAHESLNTKQLKRLKEQLGSDISYFEIRLVLAKCGVVDGS